MKFIVTMGAVALAGTANANLVSNGSLEDAQLAGPSRVSIGQLADWTASGGFMLLEQGVNNVSNIAAHSGTQFVSMGHSGASNDTLSQTLSTDAGQRYLASFYMHIIQGNATQEITGSATDGSSGATLGSVVASHTNASDGWVRYEFAFTAQSEATDLRFVHTLANGGANVTIDTISVVIPAPGTALAGLACTVLAARRHRT